MSDFTVYQYNPPSAVVTYCRDFLQPVDHMEDYLLFTVDRYQSILIVGDIDFDNLTYSDSRVYRFNYQPATGTLPSYYNMQSYGGIQSGRISNPYEVVCYGSYPGLPQLVERGGIVNAKALLVGLAVLTMYLLIRDLFKPLLRN